MPTISLRLPSGYDRRSTAVRGRLSSPGWTLSTRTCELRSPGRSSREMLTSASGSGQRCGSSGSCEATWREASAWLEQVLALPGASPPGARAEALYGAGWFAEHRGEHARAEAHGEEALCWRGRSADPLRTAMALALLGGLAHNRSDLVSARQHYEEAIAYAREAGHPHFIAMYAQRPRRRGDRPGRPRTARRRSRTRRSACGGRAAIPGRSGTPS